MAVLFHRQALVKGRVAAGNRVRVSRLIGSMSYVSDLFAGMGFSVVALRERLRDSKLRRFCASR